MLKASSRRSRATTAGIALLLVVAGLTITGCYGAPVPQVESAASGCTPVKVLLVGDSLMVQSGHAIAAALHDAGYPVEVLGIAHGGSTVVEYVDWIDHPAGFVNPRDELRHYLDTFDPDIVVAEWGINPTVSLLWDGYAWLIPWATGAGMSDVVNLVDASGAELYWTTIPWRGDAFELAALADTTNTQISQLGVPLVDWRAALSTSDGVYAQFLKYPEDDAVRPVRTEDGVHLTPDGVARVAQWTVAALAPVACK